MAKNSEARATLAIVAKVVDEFSVNLSKLSQAVKQSAGTSIPADAKKAESAFKALTASFGAATSKASILQGIGLSLGYTLTQLPINIVRELADTFAKATDEASKFQLKIAQIKTIAGKGGLVPEELGQKSIEFAGRFGQGPQAQAEAFYNVVSSGIKEVTDATNIMVSANKLATVGLSTTGDAMTGLIGLSRGFEHSLSNVNDVADALFVTVDRGLNVTLTDLVRNIGFIGPAAHAVNANMDEMLAVLAAVTNRGIATENSIIALNQIFTALQKPSKAAKDEAARLGIEFTSLTLKTKGLIPFLQEIVYNTNLTNESIGNLFGNVRAMRAFFGAVIDGGLLAEDVLLDMANKTGRVAEGFDIITQTLSFQQDRWDALFESSSIVLGSMITDSTLLRGGLTAVNDALEIYLGLVSSSAGKTNDLSDAIQVFRDILAVILEFIGNLLVLLQMITTPLRQIYRDVMLVAKGFGYLFQKLISLPDIPWLTTTGQRISDAVDKTLSWNDALDKVAEKLRNKQLIDSMFNMMENPPLKEESTVRPPWRMIDIKKWEEPEDKPKKNSFPGLDAAMRRMEKEMLRRKKAAHDFFKAIILDMNMMVTVELANLETIANAQREHNEYLQSLRDDEAERQEEHQKELIEKQLERSEELTQSLMGMFSGPFETLFDGIVDSFNDATVDIGKLFKKFISGMVLDLIKSGLLSLLGALISVLTGGPASAGLTGIFASFNKAGPAVPNTGIPANNLPTGNASSPTFISRSSSGLTSSSSGFGTSSSNLIADTSGTPQTRNYGYTTTGDTNAVAERDTRLRDFLLVAGIAGATAAGGALGGAIGAAAGSTIAGAGAGGITAADDSAYANKLKEKKAFGTTSSGSGAPVLQPVMMLPSQAQAERWFADVFMPLWRDAESRGDV